jgi:hypothetical protein
LFRFDRNGERTLSSVSVFFRLRLILYKAYCYLTSNILFILSFDVRSISIKFIIKGVAAAARTKAVLAKHAVRTIGGTRALAFASEGAVAGAKIMPPWMFYGAWSISGLAIAADITTRTWDAPPDKEKETALYWTLFHIPASLVVPAVIIHKIVHTVEHALENPPDPKKSSSSSSFSFSSLVKHIPIRFRPFIPVGAAMLSIIPVVPAVDYTAEIIMEPTLGKYLGLEFHNHHHIEEENKEKEA